MAKAANNPLGGLHGGESVGDRTASRARPLGGIIPRFVAALAACLVLVLSFTPATAQVRYVRVTGWVQWIAGERLMLALDDGSGVVPVDLTRVPLDEYRTLSGRDQVVVTGVPWDDNRGVFGLSIVPLPGQGLRGMP
jgi:hypothetical protein